MKEEKIETLFIEDSYIGGFYVRMNVNLIKASRLKCKLTGFESVLLYDICSYWESNTRYSKAQAPLKASLKEFAVEYNVAIETVKKSLTVLLKWNLIQRENNGKQTGKYAYYPNVGVLKDNLIEYTELSRKPPKTKKTASIKTVPVIDTVLEKKRQSVQVSDKDFEVRERRRLLRERCMQINGKM
jgi:hypothetical protein